MDTTDTANSNIESDRGNHDEADIQVYHLSKIWSTIGEKAVDNLCFKAYRGQVSFNFIFEINL